MAYIDSATPTVLNAQHAPQLSWFITAPTTPRSRQSNLEGMPVDLFTRLTEPVVCRWWYDAVVCFWPAWQNCHTCIGKINYGATAIALVASATEFPRKNLSLIFKQHSALDFDKKPEDFHDLKISRRSWTAIVSPLRPELSRGNSYYFLNNIEQA